MNLTSCVELQFALKTFFCKKDFVPFGLSTFCFVYYPYIAYFGILKQWVKIGTVNAFQKDFQVQFVEVLKVDSFSYSR